jgi:hypothetical protein
MQRVFFQSVHLVKSNKVKNFNEISRINTIIITLASLGRGGTEKHIMLTNQVRTGKESRHFNFDSVLPCFP